MQIWNLRKNEFESLVFLNSEQSNSKDPKLTNTLIFESSFDLSIIFSENQVQN